MLTSRHLLFLGILIFFGSGCTRLVSHRVAVYQPGGDSVVQTIPETAIYSIRFLDLKGNKVGGIPGSHRFLKEGETVGFWTDEHGHTYGLSTIYSFRIDLPKGHGAVWSSHYKKQTQIGKEVEKAAGAAGKAALYT